MKGDRQSNWTLLILTIPGRQTALRVRVWRKLKVLGVGTLQDGVYVVPARAELRQVLEDQATDIRAAGGTVQLFDVIGRAADFESLFDRGAQYQALTDRIRKATPGNRQTVARAARALSTLRRDFQAIAARDFFPGPELDQTRQALDALGARIERLRSPGEPHPKRGRIKRHEPAEYRNRTWVTRAGPWVDRLASAWLIRRFIDAGATFEVEQARRAWYGPRDRLRFRRCRVHTRRRQSDVRSAGGKFRIGRRRGDRAHWRRRSFPRRRRYRSRRSAHGRGVAARHEAADAKRRRVLRARRHTLRRSIRRISGGGIQTLNDAPETNQRPNEITLAQATRFWLRLGFISFGGPAGQIAVMHQELVERRRWISERRFLHALNYCMVLPGPEAQQLATYIGWLLHRTRGGLIAGGLFVLPSLVLLIALSWVYVAYGNVEWVAAVFAGIKPAVVAIVGFAAYRIGSRVIHTAALGAIAALAFLLIFTLNVPFPLIVIAAGVIGYIGERIDPRLFGGNAGHGDTNRSYGAALIDDDTPSPPTLWRRGGARSRRSE